MDRDHCTPRGVALPFGSLSGARAVAEDEVMPVASRSLCWWVVLAVAAAPVTSRPCLAAPPATLTVSPPAPVARSAGSAEIEYVLSRDVEAVTIEIVDAAGKKVRRVVGNAGHETASEGAVEGSGPRPSDAPGRKKGANRYVWDLRYDGATAVEGMEPGSPTADLGPLALPGTYQVRVSAAGARRTVPLTIEMPVEAPGISLDGLQRQLALALQVRDLTSAANRAVTTIRDLKAQIAARVPQAKSPVIGLAADATSRALSEVESELHQAKPGPTGESSKSRSTLNGQLEALRRRVQAGDGPPGDADYAEIKTLSATLDDLRARLTRVEDNQVAAFNRLLRNGGLAEVAVKP